MNHVHIRLRINKVPWGAGIPKPLIDALVWNGQYGVQIFFAISGFLITAMTLRRWGALSQVRIADFYRLRFARIAPLLMALLAILSCLHLAGFKPFVVAPTRGGLGRALLAALTFHVNWLEATKGYLPPNWDVLWSLSVEETFYLAFPLLCLWLGRGKWMVALLIALVLAGPFGRTVFAFNDVWQEYSYFGSMDAIAMGCLTAITLEGWKPSARAAAVLRIAGLALLALILGFSTSLRRLPVAKSGLDMSLIALGTCLIIAATAAGERTAPTLARPLIWLGRRSYEIYLTHMFVVLALLNGFLAAGKPPFGIPLFFGGTVVVAGFVGEIVARCFSEPLNLYLRHGAGTGGTVDC